MKLEITLKTFERGMSILEMTALLEFIKIMERLDLESFSVVELK